MAELQSSVKSRHCSHIILRLNFKELNRRGDHGHHITQLTVQSEQGFCISRSYMVL